MDNVVNTINLKPDVFEKFNKAKLIEQYEEKMKLSNSDFVLILLNSNFKKL